MPGAPSSFVFLVVRPGAPSSVLAHSSDALFGVTNLLQVPSPTDSHRLRPKPTKPCSNMPSQRHQTQVYRVRVYVEVM